MRRLEHSLQIAVAHMLQLVLDPEKTWWSAIDHGVGKLGVVEAVNRKRRGVKRGIPDFIIVWRGNLLGLELKASAGEKLTPEQWDVCCAWINLKHHYALATALHEVHGTLNALRVPMLRQMNFLGGGYERAERLTAARDQRPKRQRKSKSRLPVVLTRAAQT